MKNKIILSLSVLIVICVLMFSACNNMSAVTEKPPVSPTASHVPETTGGTLMPTDAPAQTNLPIIEPNPVYTLLTGEIDKKTVVLHGKSDIADETVTYYFVNNVYSEQINVTIYSSEETAKQSFDGVKTMTGAKLDGNTVSFMFVSPVFQNMNRDEVLSYWQDMITNAPEFYSNYTVSFGE